jgi:paraquat-inducible protein B
MLWRNDMTEQNTENSTFEDVPEAVVQTRKSISIVWLVPLVAALIGGWLAYKALSEKGPTITITFKSAEGLEAGKTKIKHKNVEIGQVDSIDLSEDFSHVIVTAELVKSAEGYLTENTRFWVERARVAAGQISGLGTLFSGAYIGLDPGKQGRPARSFKGLETHPIVTADLPGRRFTLWAEKLGSLDFGSPVYFRQIKVGQVLSYKLAEDGQAVEIKVFIHAPHHEQVRKNTRFWNAGGLDVTLDTEGISVETESLVSLMIGGIAFATPEGLDPEPSAQTGKTFILYDTREEAFEKTYERIVRWLLHFDGSVRGLSVGAPVEFRGVKVGEVVDLKLLADYDKMEIRVPVIIEIEPDRLVTVGKQKRDDRQRSEILVEKGFRAQLKKGSLLTGQLYVDLEFHPNAPPAKIIYGGKYPQFPTIPEPLEQITESIVSVVDKLDKFPIEQIGQDLQETMAHLNEAVKSFEKLMRDFDEKVTPEVETTLEQTQKTLIKVDKLLNAESPTGHELKRALRELADAARNISVLAEYLEKHPEALIKGKEKSNEK